MTEGGGIVRMINDLIVRGEASEIDKFVGRIEEDTREGWWNREPSVERNLQQVGIGRLGVFCYAWRGGPGRPAASVLMYRRSPGELSISSIVPALRMPLADEEYNNILADFEEKVLRPLAEGLDIKTTIVPPRIDRLGQSLSPDAFRKLNRFISMVDDRAKLMKELPMDDRARWDEFWFQVYSDGSVINNNDLGDWLMKQGLSEEMASQLIARMYVGQAMQHEGTFF